MSEPQHEHQQLRRHLGPLSLVAIAVGYVISGEYFGWNLGLPEAGPIGFLLATFFVTVMYLSFVLCMTEMAVAMPSSEGPFAYGRRAMGPLGGFLTGWATVIEFVFAPPAIAVAIGAYVHYLFPAVPTYAAIVLIYLISVTLNLKGIKESALFNNVITLLAIGGLLFCYAVLFPHFDVSKVAAAPLLPGGLKGVVAAIPFAIWLYLCIEGVALVAEETRDPQRNISIGYVLGILILMALAILVILATVGMVDYRELGKVDYVLPSAVAGHYGRSHPFVMIMAVIGLSGLIASFHSITLASSRQIFSMARAGYLPAFFGGVHPKRRTPTAALIVPSLFGLAFALSGETAMLITASGLGAVIMYVLVMLQFFILRRREPQMVRPYRVPLYPLTPIVALVTTSIAMVLFWYYNRSAILLTVGVFAGGLGYYYLTTKGRAEREAAEFAPAVEGR
ncbi:MAG: ethanolamine permease [Deltaproteobacteria bacterium]|nr:ethanolamine permease [Deltaproteobacteria bacterium]